MSKRSRSNNHHIRIRGIRRKRPDASKIARAVIDLALAEAAREAEAQQAANGPGDQHSAPKSEERRSA